MPNARSWASTATHRQPAGGGVERDAGAGDAEPDDQHVDGPVAGGIEVGCASGRGERRTEEAERSRLEVPLDEQGELPVEVRRPGCRTWWPARSRSRAAPGAGPGRAGPGRPSRTVPSAWPAPMALAEQVEHQVLVPAAALEQVGQQQLGVDLDDAHEHRVGAQRGDRARHALDDRVPGLRSRRRPSSASSISPPHSRTSRSASSVCMSGQRR